MSRRLLAALVILTVALGCMYAIGVGMERGRWKTALAESQHRADSLRLVVDARTQQLKDDSSRIDAALIAWQRFADSVRSAPRPVRYLVRVEPSRPDEPPTSHSVVDPDPIGPILALADSTIRTTDTARRQCLSVLDSCTVALAAATNRAERAEAHAAQVETAAGRRARWRTVERGVCVGSIAFNLFQLSRD